MNDFHASRISDPRAFGRVAVLMGGTSSEREVSLNSGANVLAALQARGVDARAVDGIPALVAALTGSGKTVSDTFSRAVASQSDGSAEKVSDTVFDRVFNILHGNKGGGEDGVLQGLCEALGVPCTGSGVLGTALAMDKIRSKQVWLSLGLPTPRYVRLAPGDDVHAAAQELGLPVIVKPSCEGSSVGVSRVFNDADLDEAVSLALRYPGELLMEQLIEGQELTVGVLGNEALPSIRIVPAGEYYDYHAKYVAEDTQYLCPGLEGADELAIRRLAYEAFEAIGCSGWSRVDVMRDKAGKFYLLEVNTAPGMTSHSLVPKAAAQVGIDFETLCWRILETTVPEEGRG
jgi:D-alanine-D-alanine ligase